jgi:hypothetical protein
VLTEKGSVDRQTDRQTDRQQQAGTKRGMNVAKLQCDANAMHMREFGSMAGRPDRERS